MFEMPDYVAEMLRDFILGATVIVDPDIMYWVVDLLVKN